MATVGRATVLVSPSFKGFQQDVAKESTSAGNRSGRTFGQTFSKWAGRAVKVGAGAALGVLGYSLAKGFQRLTAIEDATAKLRGLGHSAGTVQKAMDSALAAVKGTAYGLDEAATVAASVMAAGVKPGKELERTLKLVADAATIGGSSMSEMGDIFNKVATSNKVQGDVINQLNAQGIPIIQMLAKSMGKTSEEVLELSRKGEIGFAEFQKAMEQGLGGAALESGNTTMGALKNVQAALGRFGAALLSGIFPSMKKGFGGMITLIDNATTAITPFAEAIGQKLGVALERMVGWISSLDYSSVGAFFKSMGAGASKAGSVLGELGKSFLNLASVLPDVARGAIDILAAALGFLAKHMDKIVKFLPYIVAGWAAYRAASLAVTAATQKLQAAQLAMTPVMTLNNILRLAAIKGERRHAIASGQYTAAASAQAGLLGSLATLRARDVAGMVAQRVAAFATAAATKAMAVAQRILNLAMRANPIGLIITGLMLLVGGIVLAYKKSETFRNIVQGAWTGIKNAATVVVTWFQTVAWPVLQRIFAAVGNAAKWLWTNAIAPAVNGIMAVWRKMASVIKAVWTGFLSPVFQLIGAIVKWLAIKIFKAHVAIIQRVWNTFAAVFRKAYTTIIQPIISYFKKAIQGWKIIISAAIRVVQRVWSALGTAIRSVYNRHLKPIVDAFKRIVAAMRDSIRARIASIKDYWSGMGSAIRSVYNRHLKPIVDALKSRIKTVKDAFKTAVDGVKTQWNKLEGVAKKPIRFVVNTVINKGLIGAFNKLAGAFGTSKMSEVSLPRGFDRGGWTGPGAADQPAGVVHADEFVISKAARRSIERKHPGLLDHMLLYGDVPGYKKGGRVWPVKNRHWTTYPGHTGIDFPVPMGTPVFASEAGTIAKAAKLGVSYGWHYFLRGKSGITTIYAHLSKMIARAGQAVTAGAQIGNVGSTGNSTGPHLHFETRPGGTPGAAAGYLGGAGAPKGGILASAISKVMGAFSSVKDWLVSKFRGPLDKLKEITSNPFGRLAAGLPRKIKGDLIDYAVDKMSFDSGGMLQPGYTLAYNGTRRPEPVFTAKQHDAMLAGGPQRMVGELVLKNGRAYIEGIVSDVAADALTARSY